MAQQVVRAAGTFVLVVAALLIVMATLSVGVSYALFMVVWMHAPPLEVVALTLALSVPPLVIAWCLSRFAEAYGCRQCAGCEQACLKTQATAGFAVCCPRMNSNIGAL
jgi:hypothetical protein